MKKSIIKFLLVASSMITLIFTGEASAENHESGVITITAFNSNASDTLISKNGGFGNPDQCSACGTGSCSYVTFKVISDAGKSLYSLSMLAFVAGKTATFYYSGCNGWPIVYRIDVAK